MTKMERIERLEIEVARLKDELAAMRREKARPVAIPNLPGSPRPWWLNPVSVTSETWDGRLHA